MRPFRRSWGRGTHTAIGWMCWPAEVDTGTRADQQLGEAPGGRLRHWGRAALELRRVRRGSMRIPLRGNPGRTSTGKAPGRASQEPGRAATRVVQAARETANEAAGPVGGSPRLSKGDRSPPPPRSSANSSQVGGLGPRVEERGREVGGCQGKTKEGTLTMKSKRALMQRGRNPPTRTPIA
ncbi:hypothetical protein NDU88_004638 [Pleurodeles waltl]|uniref:Uncharacterized protein n=1 Tax=Pleurodeles waltl TaxID=8319 RepID=A0AAV7RGA6_PLEWA|nr:hypothetical protein NDU88_004638 [Pleurodeles waltl]